MLSLAGRGAIIAGTRRVGAVVAKRLASEGVRLAITYRRSRSEAEALAEEVRSLTDRVVLVQADLVVEADVQRIVQEAHAALGDLSFCINLASDYPKHPLEELDAAAWDHGMQLAKATYLLTLAASKVMMNNEGPTRGHHIFFGDWAAGQTPYHDYLPYLTAKAAVEYMARAFAFELAPHGIQVNAIAPGPTAFGVGVTQQEWDSAIDATPLKRESSPDDIAELIVALLKTETVTGETIRVDSGRHLAGTARQRRRQTQ